jgi:predicted MFS family arabinose efflux permease
MINIYNILLIISCYFTANFIYAPTLSLVASDFGVSSDLAKATMTLFQAGALISCIIAALFADFLGKKNYLVFGLTLATLGSVICIFAPNIYLIMLGRVLQGFGAAVGFMMGFALAVDLFKPEETLKIVAINGITVSVISVISPYLGGYLAETLSWRAVFIFIAPFFLIAQIASYRYLPSQANIRQAQLFLKKNLVESGTILVSRRYLAYASLNGILSCGLLFSMSFLPFYYTTHFQFSSDIVGLILGSTLFISFGLASILSIRFSRAMGTDNVIRMGLTVNLCGGLLMGLNAFAFPRSVELNIIALIMYGYGFGTLYAGSISESMRVFLQLTTKASAIRTVMLTVGSFLGTFIAQNANDQYLSNLAITLTLTSAAGIFMFSIRGRTPA